MLGRFPPDGTPIHALVHRRWLVEATCLGIPPERWVWQVAGWREGAGVVEEVAAALACDDPSPRPRDAELVEHVPPPRRRPRCAGLGSAMEVIWDLLIFLALVAVGLLLLNLLARRR
jgi:hypothetical protein